MGAIVVRMYLLHLNVPSTRKFFRNSVFICLLAWPYLYWDLMGKYLSSSCPTDSFTLIEPRNLLKERRVTDFDTNTL